MSQPEQQEARREGVRAPWERPTLTALGNVTDLVKAGKGGSGQDADLGNSRKFGVG